MQCYLGIYKFLNSIRHDKFHNYSEILDKFGKNYRSVVTANYINEITMENSPVKLKNDNKDIPKLKYIGKFSRQIFGSLFGQVFGNILFIPIPTLTVSTWYF